MTTEKTALVFGASGLVGGNLVKELIQNPAYARIFIFVRNTLAIVHPKVNEFPFDKYTTADLTGVATDVAHVFCCLGTTIKKAGTKEAFKHVDYGLPVEIATWAKEKGISTFAVISSIGANSKSGNFYLRTKGEMEDSVRALGFTRLVIVRPSLILGNRTEFRLAEELAQMSSGVLNLILFGPLKKYRGIKATTIARAMMLLANSNIQGEVFESDKLQEIGEK